MTYLKFIICSILSISLAIGSNIKTTSAQTKSGKISFTEAFPREIIYDSNNTQLSDLDLALNNISKDAKRKRIWQSYGAIGIGAFTVFFGFSIRNDSRRETDGLPVSFDTAFMGLGAAMIMLGIRESLVSSDVEKYYMEFRDLPEVTPDDAERKLIAGELRFEKYAQSARRSRYNSSGLIIILGIFSASEDEGPLLGVFYVGVGFWRYFSKSKLEKAYDNYIAKKEIYSVTDISNNLSWKMFPLHGKGMGVVVTLDF